MTPETGCFLGLGFNTIRLVGHEALWGRVTPYKEIPHTVFTTRNIWLGISNLT